MGDDLLQTAVGAARSAGELVRGLWVKPRTLSAKGFRDWVTDADVASQAHIAAYILARHPGHGFLPEEESDLPKTGPVIWAVDPIDGTTNFSRGVPLFSISIAGLVDGRAVVGVVYDVLRDELFAAGSGRGATLNDKPITTSDRETLATAIMALDWSRQPHLRQEAYGLLGRVVNQVHTVRAIGSAALALAWVACGRLDGYFNLSLSTWDIAAGQLLVEEAGGVCKQRGGGDFVFDLQSMSCVADNGQISKALAEILV